MHRKFLDSSKWQRLSILSLLISYFFVFMEWLFFVTKPSFMDSMEVADKIGILFSAGGILGISSTITILIFLITDSFLFKRLGSFKYTLNLASIIPALLLAILSLLLIDNFTYTVFKFGVVSSQGIFRAIYVLIFLLILLFFYRWVLHFIEDIGSSRTTLKFFYAASLILFFITLIFTIRQYGLLQSQSLSSLRTLGDSLPNILILGSDGVNATNMSVYGYERETTPFLNELAGTSLVAENAFTNAGNSTGSVTSILTGKLPIQTLVLYSPNILMDEDAYQHLPGILRRLGYYNVEIGVSKYVDSYDVNLQDGFDVVNQRSIDNQIFFRIGRTLGFGDVFYFLSRISERITDRILHIFYVRTMDNSYELVTQLEKPPSIDDRERVDQLLELLTSTSEPLFVHVHLMGTHGPKFYPRQRVFSANSEQNDRWMNDFYDDAILDYDAYVKEVFKTLSESGKLDNTIVVIYTDHNQKYRTTQRIPLMFYFPGGEHAGRIQNNVQNIDIAPTLLDYLGITPPQWMAGLSLLQREPPANRLIFSATAGETDPEEYKPPFYQFGNFGIVLCDQWYEYYARSSFFVTSTVLEHTSPCDKDQIPQPDFIRTELLVELQSAKFEVAALPADFYTTLPNGEISHSHASVFIVKTLYGASFVPPPATGIFEDVPPSSEYAPWIEYLYLAGIDEGCSASPMKYCPDRILKRGDTAKLILKAINGGNYNPPSATGLFVDVPISSPLSPWIEELYHRGITAGCVADPLSFCPDDSITMGQLLKLFLSAMEKT